MGEARRRRGRSEVICDILSEALGGANKTRLMYRCNLNFGRFNRYLSELLESGMIVSAGSNPGDVVVYRTSDKGRELLQVLRKANDLMSV
jgi:predicted transcriptional regulator